MKFYEKTWFTVLMLLLFFPVGLFLMWKYQKFNVGARIIISGFFGFLILSNLLGDSDTNESEATAVKEEETVTVDAEAETEEPTAEEVAAAEQAAKEEQEKADAEAAKKAAEEEAARKAAEEKRKEELSLSGSGQQATGKFTLEDGFVVIKSTHNGGSNFAMELLDENANVVQLVTNEIGSYNGSQVFAIDAGTYQYNVTADGAWTIEMSQEIPDEVVSGSASGKGDTALFMDLEDGAQTFSFTHDGQSNFAVQANDSVLLVNEIGAYEGSQVQRVDDAGVYFFNITADGNWTINVE
ncbi:hypothetical protein [Exiguobacterium sp. s196]|uniref:hypothetical protein n=1 Tax=Exiguobacterium sp. s196 TaxID=2751283 RepID=UPI001BE5D61C|nr:hypothetical protein [Exiguobacterium sp. s196]